jgi:RNA polymerase sigma-70 factor (ECF subfamily)
VINLCDEEIIAGMRSGNENSFIEMVNNYKKKVISLCYSYTSDYQEAEDLSQEVFISLFKNIFNFRGDCSLSTYIYRITVSRCLDYKRKRSIKNFLTGLTGNVEKETADADIDEKNYVQQCIKALKEDLRLPVVMHYYIGLNYNEIAEILNTSAKAVEGRIYRAKQKLRVEFEKGGYCKWTQKEMI